MVKTVGSYEAKTHLPQLLEEVQRGDEIVITKHGKAIAKIISPGGADLTNQEEAVQRMVDFMNSRPKGLVTTEELIAWKHEGHRY